MTLLDIVLILFLVLAAVTGFRAGATGQVGTIAGALVGLVVGGGVASAVAGGLDVPARPWLVWLVVLVLCVALGAVIGGRIGALVGRGISGVGLGWFDGALGAVLRVGLVLAVVWVAAGVAVAVGSPRVDRAVRDSTVLQTLDDNLPDRAVVEGRLPSELQRLRPSGS